MLLPVQEQLLEKLVEAARSAPGSDSRDFLVIRLDSADILDGPGGGFRLQGEFYNDLQVLLGADLVHQSSPGQSDKGSLMFFVTPRGFAHYEEIRRRSGQPAREIEKVVREYLDDGQFRQRHPDAYAKLAEAADLLWGAESQKELTTIGHKTREAIQQFATSLVDQYQPPEVDPNPAHTVARLESVIDLNRQRLGDDRRQLLDALNHYWGSVNDIIQRQVHGEQKAGDPLAWEDGRRCVFQTAVVMFEVDRELARDG